LNVAHKEQTGSHERNLSHFGAARTRFARQDVGEPKKKEKKKKRILFYVVQEMNPTKRISAVEALSHPYFDNVKLPEG
jgi:hypothetical protein